jgi:hypothetical protein
MQLTAKLAQILPPETGMGKNGEWKKQSLIMETDGQFPKKICVTAWGDKFPIDRWHPGLQLTIDFDIESREFNGRWYTDLKAWKIEPADAAMPEPPAPPIQLAPPAAPAERYDDLPF